MEKSRKLEQENIYLKRLPGLLIKVENSQRKGEECQWFCVLIDLH
jgi:hypothetical protein